MRLDRKLIKSQARQLISGKVFPLFIVTLVVLLLTQGPTLWTNISEGINQYNDSNYAYNDDNYGGFNGFGDDSDNYGFGYFGDDSQGDDFYGFNGSEDGDSEDNPIENFDGRITALPMSIKTDTAAIAGRLSAGVGIFAIIFMPLEIGLAGYYLYIIRTANKVHIGSDLGGIFSRSFKNYGKWFVLVLLRTIFTVLLCCLFIIPGIIYSYSTYFAYELMSDNPNLKPMEALRLSRKMVRGHRTELFVLDLSFIPWYLLLVITLGIASIYVDPYVYTTKALYYQNFRARSLATGETVEQDYLSAEELNQRYAQYNGGYQPYNSNCANGGYQQPNPGAYPPPYTNPVNSNQNYDPNGTYTQQPYGAAQQTYGNTQYQAPYSAPQGQQQYAQQGNAYADTQQYAQGNPQQPFTQPANPQPCYYTPPTESQNQQEQSFDGNVNNTQQPQPQQYEANAAEAKEYTNSTDSDTENVNVDTHETETYGEENAVKEGSVEAATAEDAVTPDDVETAQTSEFTEDSQTTPEENTNE